MRREREREREENEKRTRRDEYKSEEQREFWSKDESSISSYLHQSPFFLCGDSHTTPSQRRFYRRVINGLPAAPDNWRKSFKKLVVTGSSLLMRSVKPVLKREKTSR